MRSGNSHFDSVCIKSTGSYVPSSNGKPANVSAVGRRKVGDSRAAHREMQEGYQPWSQAGSYAVGS